MKYDVNKLIIYFRFISDNMKYIKFVCIILSSQIISSISVTIMCVYIYIYI